MVLSLVEAASQPELLGVGPPGRLTGVAAGRELERLQVNPARSGGARRIPIAPT